MIRLALAAAFLASSAPLRADDVVSGCVWIRAENDGSGAGFLVDAKKRWVVTCRHVVADRDTVDVYFAWRKNGKLVTGKSEYLGNRVTLRELGLLLRGKVVKKSDDADLALVELDSLPAGASALKFAASMPCPGDPLRAIGHRIDLDTVFNFTSGSVRQAGRLANGYPWRGKKLAVNAEAILGQLPIEEGDSGGPVLDGQGEVVGMVSALRRQTPEAAIAISAAEIRRFLQVEHPKAKSAPPNIGDALMRSTVWVRPSATDLRTAGVLISKELILTSNRGLGSADRVGIAFPRIENDKWIAESGAYRDFTGLYLKDAWADGEVIARDADLDLALIRIWRRPVWMRPVALATVEPAVGDPVHSMSHPGGVEFAWMYAAGSIRQRGKVALAEGEKPVRVPANVLQLPAQTGSAGGPILNDKGELIGILAARESAQQTGYSPAWSELDHFLNVNRRDLPARSLEALAARAVALKNRCAESLASALSQLPEAEDRFRLALLVDPKCFRARFGLYRLLQKGGNEAEAAAELDRGIQQSGDPSLLQVRAERHIKDKNWQAARGDLQRIRAEQPSDSYSARLLFRVLLELKKDEEAAAAVGDAIRLMMPGLPAIRDDLLEQADELEKKFPDAPSVPVNWLRLAIGAAAKYDPFERRREKCEVILKAAAKAENDAARLRLLRDFLQTIP